MRKILNFILVFVLLLPEIIMASPTSKQHMISTLDTIKQVFEAQYAPAAWKYTYMGWNLENETQVIKDKILTSNNLSIKEFQQLIRQLMLSTADYHTAVIFYSTERASLPFRVKGVNKKYFITAINREQLSEKNYPIQVGDELVSFGGCPTDEVVQELRKSEHRFATEETDRSHAENTLTSRFGMLGTKIPKGPIMIVIRSAETEKLHSYQLIWDYYPERIKSGSCFPSSNKLKENPLMKQQMLYPLTMAYNPSLFKKSDKDEKKDHEEEEEEDEEEKSWEKENVHPNSIGMRKSFLPRLGSTIVWESGEDSFFQAYIYQKENGKKVGVIRIPHYVFDEEEVGEFAQFIHLMQKETDMLVIDQLNNAGGNVYCTYAIASMLTDQALYTPKHRMMITQALVMNALQILQKTEKIKTDEEAQELFEDTFWGYPVNYQVTKFLGNWCQFIVDEWNNGNHFTQPTYLLGVDYINPNGQARYTKPLLILINGLDFSGGDFFPAILQDNKRAVTMGTKTAGAGGYLTFASFPNRFGIAFMFLTGSYAERLDLSPLENLGVKPDIECELTENDLKHGFQDYTSSVNQVVEQMLMLK